IRASGYLPCGQRNIEIAKSRNSRKNMKLLIKRYLKKSRPVFAPKNFNQQRHTRRSTKMFLTKRNNKAQYKKKIRRIKSQKQSNQPHTTGFVRRQEKVIEKIASE
ncbi:3931_t:CDS:2, partial [Gigaspora margarita]